MTMFKFIQVNIYKGKYLGSLIDFLKSEDPDFVAMQEVTAGGANNYEDKKADIFEILKDKTGLSGVCHKDLKFIDDPTAGFGNAVLSKHTIIDSNVLALRESGPLKLEAMNMPDFWPSLARHLLDVTVSVGSRKIHVMSWHGAWTAPPQDTPETLRQAQMVRDYLKSAKEPFILGVDINNVPESKVVGLINTAAQNLMSGSGVRWTTHPTIHKIAPRKLLVDYIFTSPDFELESLIVPEVVVSDHLPVVASLRFPSAP